MHLGCCSVCLKVPTLVSALVLALIVGKDTEGQDLIADGARAAVAVSCSGRLFGVVRGG